MKNRMLSLIAKCAAAFALFAAFASVGTASMHGMYQPKVPERLLK